MQLDVGSEPTFRIALVTCMPFHIDNEMFWECSHFRVKFQTILRTNPSCYKLKKKKLLSRQTTDRQTESDAYEPTVQYAQVGSKTKMNRNN